MSPHGRPSIHKMTTKVMNGKTGKPDGQTMTTPLKEVALNSTAEDFEAADLDLDCVPAHLYLRPAGGLPFAKHHRRSYRHWSTKAGVLGLPTIFANCRSGRQSKAIFDSSWSWVSKANPATSLMWGYAHQTTYTGCPTTTCSGPSRSAT